MPLVSLIIWQALILWTVKSVLSRSPTLTTAMIRHIRVMRSSEVPLYKLLSYFTAQTQSNDPKVRELSIPELQFYTHMYHAWLAANQNMSLVVVNAANQDIVGCNMVIELNKLRKMFAPGPIEKVLDFAIPCYESARPAQMPKSSGYVSTLRATSSDQIEATLLRQTLLAFLEHAAPGSHHLAWSYSRKTNEELERLKYSAVSCRGGSQENVLCDWSLLDMHGDWEKSQCLYRYVKPVPRK